MNKIKVSTPASSANLGPGFDCFGIALDIRNDFYVEFPADNYKYEFMNSTPGYNSEDPDQNLFIKTYKKLSDIYGKDQIPISVKCNNRIPFESGMGSSASAIVAAVGTFRYIHGLPIENNTNMLLDILRFENHPDNTGASLFGGFIVAYNNFDQEKVMTEPTVFHANVPETLKIWVFHPHERVNTIESRSKLPEKITLNSAIESFAKTAIIMGAIQQGEFHYLREALLDKIHEPLRMSPHLNYPELKKQLLGLDEFYGWALSGSGPSVIIFCEKVTDRMKNTVKEYMNMKNVSYTEYDTGIDNKGLLIEKLT